mgnify:CR=1 FL=1|tara:strand:+ start:43063 stop:43554 length:492 start_codon:yes stop_codon:yes gene_type:complete
MKIILVALLTTMVTPVFAERDVYNLNEKADVGLSLADQGCNTKRTRKMISKPEKTTYILNSKGMEYQVFCKWEKKGKLMKLSKCYQNTALDFLSFGIVKPYFELQFDGEITYDHRSGAVFQEDEKIGDWYKDLCGGGFRDLSIINITEREVLVDEYSMEISIY